MSILLVEQNAALALDLADARLRARNRQGRHVGSLGRREDRRERPQILPRLLRRDVNGTVSPADRLRPRQRRHLCLRGPRAGHDLRVDRPHQLRPGRDGDVQHLHRLAVDVVGDELLGRLRPHRDDLLCHGRADRTVDPETAAQRAGPVDHRGVHRPAGDLQLDGRRLLELPDQGVPVAVSQERASASPA